MSKIKSDCDIILDSAENMFSDLGNCIESTFNEKKTKMNVVGSIYRFGKSLTKLTLNTGYCAIKNTPKAVIAVSSMKRELVESIEEGIENQKKQAKKDALDAKIKHLSLKV